MAIMADDDDGALASKFRRLSGCQLGSHISNDAPKTSRSTVHAPDDNRKRTGEGTYFDSSIAMI